MAKGKRVRGRHYSAFAKFNLILFKPRILLTLLVLLVFLIYFGGILAYFTDIASVTNPFSIVATYQVGFNANGGNGQVRNQEISYNVPTQLREVNFTRDGYRLVGWNSNREGTGTSYELRQTVLQTSFNSLDDVVILYAVWEPINEDAVAMIGETYYDTLQEAIDAVPTDGTLTTVTLLKDISENLTVDAGKNIKFVFGDHTISVGVDPIFEIFGKVEISDGTLMMTGANTGAVNVDVGGELTISGGQIINTSETGKQAVYNLGGTINISGGYIENASKPGVADNKNLRGAVHNKAGIMTITGGTIVGKNYVGVQNESELTIGVKDNNPDPSTPIIQGGVYGLTNGIESTVSVQVPVHNKICNLYNGVIKGKTAAIDDESLIDEKETGYVIAHYGETIDNEIYIAAHLATETKTVTFNPNGGQVEEQTRTVETNHIIGSLPAAYNAGKDFVGWFTLPNGGTEITPSYVVTSDITIYAHWEDHIVCKIGDVGYSTINDAISAARNNQQTTITVIRNIELYVADKININPNKNIVLDLNGHTISNVHGQVLPLIENQGTLEITQGILTSDTTQGIINNKKGTTTINGTTIIATGTRQAIYCEKGTVNITGGADLRSISSERATVQTLSGATLNIVDATITSTNFHGVENAGTVNIGNHDGNITTATPTIIGNDYGVNRASGTVNFYDGTVKGLTGTFNGTVSNIEANSHRQVDFEIIDGLRYYIEFLVED